MMKQIIRLYALFVVCCLLLAGCNSEEDMGNTGKPVAVHFGSGKVDKPKATSRGEQWTLNDPIGIFMVKNGQALAAANIVESADNKQYRAQTGGSDQSGFGPVLGTDIIYYPHDGSKVDFVSYYPYKWPLTNYMYPVDVSIQTTPDDMDVLYVNTVNTNNSGYNKNSSTVDLLFNHALSKLSFTLVSGDGNPNLTGAKAEITNLATTADLNLANGEFITTNSGQTVTPIVSANGLSCSAIVVPQALSGAKLIVTLAGGADKHEWDFPASAEFLTGRDHQYTIKVSKTGIIVTCDDITTWTGKDDLATPGTTETGYKVGDYYPDPGAIYKDGALVSGTAAIGVVFWLSNQNLGDHPDNKVSQHGKIVGLYESQPDYLDDVTAWTTNYGTTYNAGTGWYVPAFGDKDFHTLYCAYNGMPYEEWYLNKPNNISKDLANRSWFNNKITDAGGDRITDSWYWISAVTSTATNTHQLHFNSGNIRLASHTGGDFKTRAIKAF